MNEKYKIKTEAKTEPKENTERKLNKKKTNYCTNKFFMIIFGLCFIKLTERSKVCHN